MVKGKRIGGVGKQFKEKPPGERLNSQNIRRLFYDVIREQFGGSYDRAFDELSTLTASSNDPRGYDRELMISSLQSIVLDKHGLHFSHLNALAKFYRVPVSILLIFTRIRDEMENVENRAEGSSLAIIRGIRSACEFLERTCIEHLDSEVDVLDFLGHPAFLEFVRVYRDERSADGWTQQSFLPTR